MRTNKIIINNQSRLGPNNNNLSKYKNIYESRLLKPEIKIGQNLGNQEPIRRSQKPYYKKGSLASNQNILNQNQNCINNNYNHHGGENDIIQILKGVNYKKNHIYHEIDMTTKKNIYQIYNKQNKDGGKIDLNQYNQDKNERIYYNINNNKAINFFKESLRKNEEIKKFSNTINQSKFLNEENKIISKNKITNFPLKEEGCSKASTNYDKKSEFQKYPIPKKIYLLNKNKNIENQYNNYNNDNSKKSNNFRNSSIQYKNLAKYTGNAKENNLKSKDRISKSIINYQKYQSIKKFFNCKIHENENFVLFKKNEKKTFSKLEDTKNEFFAILRDEKKKIILQKISESFLLKGKNKKEKLLKPESSQNFLIEGKEEKNLFKKEAIQQINFEGKGGKDKNKTTDKEKIMEILKRNNCTNEEIREILREFYVIINPNIEGSSKKKNELNENSQKNANDNILIETPQKELKEIRDNGIQSCDSMKKKKKEKEIIIQEEKWENDNLKRSQKIYGFRNEGNNCYLNSSLQLLTRIKELKDEVLNFGKSFQDNETQGNLIVEFRKILNSIENSSHNNLIINPLKLKRIMGNVDSKYFYNGQEDSNEFISNFLNALLSETGNKEAPLKKINITNESDKKPYETLFKKFFKRRGDSFVIDLFYGILKTTKFCKNCGKTSSIKLSMYNMLEFQLYILGKKNPNKDLSLSELYKNYLDDKLSEGESCSFCDSDNIYLRPSVYTLPKYLMICLQRACDNQYFHNKVIYPSNLKIKGEFDDNVSSYILDCVIEHSGGSGFGHYTALVPIDKDNNTWWRFSDSYWNEANNGFKSDNSFLLLYKLIKK